MTADEGGAVVRAEIGNDWSQTNLHGADLRTCLMRPREVECLDTFPEFNKGKPLRLWIVLEETPGRRVGYLIVFDDERRAFRLRDVSRWAEQSPCRGGWDLMDTQTLAEAILEPLAVPVDRRFPISLDVYHGRIDHGLLTKYDKVELLDGLMYRFSLDVYHGMIEHGLLTEHDDVVLLDGLLMKKRTRGAPHVRVTIRASRELSAVVPEGWDVSKAPARDAWANIPVAWLVNLNDRTVEVHTRPSGPTAPQPIKTPRSSARTTKFPW